MGLRLERPSSGRIVTGSMSVKILISPYSAGLINGEPNPKNYPHWPKLIKLLNETGYDVIQIGLNHEARLEGVGQFVTNWPFDKLVQLVRDCATWVSVDNFFPHFVYYHRLKSGIVLWGQSDPTIWGHPENINLLRSREYLRQFQYDTWMAAKVRPEAFVYAENVMPHVVKLAPPPLVRVASI